MKMVKSLLLGTAAGLVAMTGAQAADLPVKAKPVQYVKICSLYGAGFYYIPGTDMCLKMGGWVRFEAGSDANGSLTAGPGNGDYKNRLTNDMTWRSRGYITADARNQSEYGTIRSYIAVGINTNSTGVDASSNTFSSNRAFIQFAGFTFGLSQSFFDFYSVPATALFGWYPASDTGDPGWQVAAYTAQFGGGLSATLSAEQRRMTQIFGGGAQAVAGGNSQAAAAGSLAIPSTGFPGAYGGFKVPDFVANLRVDQAWGSAQLMGALHQVNGQYYSTNGFVGEGNGHPGDKWGFAVGAGLKFFAPSIGAGDYLQAQINYAQGASRYVISTPNQNWGIRKGDTAAFGILTDAVYGGNVLAGTSTDLQLTTAWGFNAAYEHFWSRAWRTSLYGGYAAISYGGLGNAMICVGQAAGSAAVAGLGCNNNWATWWVGSRTQWNITPDTYLALDVIYDKLNTATANNVGTVSTTVYPAILGGGNLVKVADQDTWAVRFRAHKDFYP